MEALMTGPCKIQMTLADGRKFKAKFRTLREVWVEFRYKGKLKKKLMKVIQK